MNVRRGTYGPAFWTACVVGWSVIAFGVITLAGRNGVRGAVDVGGWVLAGNVVHDVIVGPAAFAIAFGVTLVVRRPWRAPIFAGLFATALAIAVAYPALRGFGRKAGNPSVLPLDYVTAVTTVVAVVWGIVVLWCIVVAARRRFVDDRPLGAETTR